ncbi:glycosyltransferase [Aquisalimonas lutea]|uniref:glycosyltransferase n=1 Tax=Aquisalimonas lutea TaxID=1327750 RepID=UPI0025B43D27|nr:glycosyltransferase [Aquisalimonas lutea]MDN3516438.1 glycosyltransferase [Aquisalimonas lutea]
MSDLPTEQQAASGLRVAFFSDSLPERNGTGAYYHDLVEYLRPRLEAVQVIQPRPRTGRWRLAMPLPGDSTQTLVVPNLWRVRRAMRQLRPHLVVTVTPGPFGLLGLWLARRHGCGFISAYHTNFEGLADLYWGPLRRRLITGAMRGVNRFIGRRSATVLGNSDGLTGTLEGLGAPRVDIVGTPLDPRFLEAPQGLEPGPLDTICFAGRLAAEKNLEAVLDAAREHPDIHFVIGGDGPLRDRVEAAARELGNVEYRGWLDRARLRAMIDGARLLVLPSHLETFGSVALEAMARGRPALVSENAGIRDWPELRPGLFAYGRDESLAGAIHRLRGLTPGELAAAGDAARAAAVAFNERTIDDWLRVLGRHGRGNPCGR